MVSKVQERIFVDEAMKLLGVEWQIIDEGESPDFGINDNGEEFGLEVRQVFVDEVVGSGSSAKKLESDQQRLIQIISTTYYKNQYAPLHVQFAGTIAKHDVKNIVEILAKSRPKYFGPESLLEFEKVSVGELVLYLKPLPPSFEKYSRWISVSSRVGWVSEISSSSLQSAVDSKAAKLPSYKVKYEKNVLLLVADRTYNSGRLAGSCPIKLLNPGFHKIYFMSRLESIRCVG